MFPLVSFEPIDIEEANSFLTKWGHAMGPCNRPFPPTAYALRHVGQPVCVAIHGCLISQHVGGGADFVTRENGIELARLCAVRPDLCRVGLRLWREFVYPWTGATYAVSYQDKGLHSGNLYRFDGWQRIGESRSGTDKRSGRKGRSKIIWLWSGSKSVRDGLKRVLAACE